MTQLDKLKEDFVKIIQNNTNKPLADAIAKTRHEVFLAVEKRLRQIGAWDRVKREPPGKFFLVTQNPMAETEIQIILSDPLKRILNTKL